MIAPPVIDHPLSALLPELAADGRWGAVRVGGLTQDSRRVRPGDAFVALAGRRHHGLDHARDAIASGAVVVLYERGAREPEAGLPAVAVDDLRTRLGAIAARAWGDPSRQLVVIGVTGTNGKTSTVQLLAQALSRAGHVVGTIGTLGAGIHPALDEGERTTPDVIAVHGLLAALRAAGASHVAMEVSSHALDQGRVDGVHFAVAVYTNLSRDHLDYHADMDAYFAAKARLFTDCAPEVAVINLDDARGAGLAARARAGRVIGVSAAAAATITASEVRLEPDGIAFTLGAPDGRAAVRSGLLGRFNVDNLLAVAGVLHVLGWGVARIADALARLKPVRGRMNRLGGEGARPLVVVDYAHTPDALAQALTSLRGHARGRLWCVFGCGGERDAGKRPQMAAAAERLADAVIVTDDNPRGEDGDRIVADIRAGFARPERVCVERDRARAIARAVTAAAAGDVVLIAGKGHETCQEIAGRRLPFDDLAVARAALEARP